MYRSNGKYCITCEYWNGPREIEYSRGWASTDSQTTIGKCCCSDSPWRAKNKRAYESGCPEYVKWSCL